MGLPARVDCFSTVCVKNELSAWRPWMWTKRFYYFFSTALYRSITRFSCFMQVLWGWCGRDQVSILCSKQEPEWSRFARWAVMFRVSWWTATTEANHAYFYQVQTQLHFSGREYCDCIVWTEQDLHVERIEPDPSLWAEIVGKSELL